MIIFYTFLEEFVPIDEAGDELIFSCDTYAECVEIVLPQHANHHQTTFGGQVGQEDIS